MKKAQCQSIAKSTQKQCEKPPLSGTQYCWLHHPKKEIIVFFILGIFLTFLFQIVFDLFTISSEEHKINKLQQQAKELSNQNQELIEGKNTLIAQNKDLSEKLDKYQKDLNEKEQKIKELETQAKNAKRGITVNFYANGTRRKTDGGNISLDQELKLTYEHMKNLSEEKRYPELVTLCKKQIRNNPDWPTPYLFLGVALGNSGEIDEAINQLEYFLEIAPTLSSYGYNDYRKQAKKFIEILKNKSISE